VTDPFAKTAGPVAGGSHGSSVVVRQPGRTHDGRRRGSRRNGCRIGSLRELSGLQSPAAARCIPPIVTGTATAAVAQKAASFLSTPARLLPASWSLAIGYSIGRRNTVLM
jgi:hypothetical protein